ncbi:M23/M56 family metallopeptidase [Alkalimonas sp. NCh-2]|uniref:M23/M56 family metallopeptidase n=1 Tax=Alkalimonas sp. NCh-2 TaxID=3144846 RepID=UPI0031F6C7E5
MAQQLLLSLLLCSLWTLLLWQVSRLLLKKFSALQQWPPYFWCLLGLCFLPLLPLPELGQQWTIPSVLLQDTLHAIQAESAQPLHPGLLQPTANSQFIWWLLLGGLGTVSLWQLYRLVRQWQQLQRLIRQSKPLAAASLFSPEQLAALPARFELRQTQTSISPFIAGWRHMVLVVPAYMWQLTAEQRRLLLQHELTHLQRRDPQQLLLLRLLVALCWFNPLLRQLEQAFIQSVELAVDRAVLANEPGSALLYGQTLLNSLKRCQHQAQPKLNAAFMHANSGHSFYQQRLQQLFHPAPALSSWQRWRIPLLLGFAALLLNIGYAQLNYSAPPTQWLLPVGQVPITSAYATQHPLRQNRPHQGVDFGAARGSDIQAAQRGKVLIADATSLHSRYGKVVLIDHGHGYQTLYAHLDAFYVTAGQSVAAGEPIGTVGASGQVTGPHLHFELLLDGQHQDPALYLALPKRSYSQAN